MQLTHLVFHWMLQRLTTPQSLLLTLVQKSLGRKKQCMQNLGELPRQGEGIILLSVPRKNYPIFSEVTEGCCQWETLSSSLLTWRLFHGPNHHLRMIFGNLNLNLRLSDFWQAFHSELRYGLETTASLWSPTNFINQLCDGATCRVIHEFKLTLEFKVKTRVGKRYMLSPLIFLQVVDRVKREVTKTRLEFSGCSLRAWKNLTLQMTCA